MTRPRAPWSSNFTRPSTFANSVSSLPRPTFRPGRKRRPRCRTRIDPPVTTLPSNRLTPSRCELLSRPLRDEPCPFLCAMTFFQAATELDDDVGDANAGVGGAVPFRPAHVLAALLLEHADLRTARLAVDDAENLDVGDKRRTGQDLAAVLLEYEDPVDADFLTHLGLEVVNSHDRSLADLQLTAAALNDCEHARTLRPAARMGITCCRQRY